MHTYVHTQYMPILTTKAQANKFQFKKPMEIQQVHPVNIKSDQWF